MKKILLFTLLSSTCFCFAQVITVNTATYTVPQLVNTILSGNACQQISNVTWSTGTNFGAANGIGYFQNTNPAFPMTGGVVLATTGATTIVGPNTSNLNPNPSWPGNAELTNALSLPAQSHDATVLEFDFIPVLSGYFSIDFLYASEEYQGNLQCNYSDRFVFLLRNLETGTVTNLAVVPNTNIPVSGLTVRDNQVSPACPSQNIQYFGAYHTSPEAAAASATNFNGETKVLEAKAILQPGVPYHLKMIIADYGDPIFSSAVFLEENSLNTGQEVLGPDKTIAANAAFCNGNTYVLGSGLNAGDYTFIWEKDGVNLTNENGSSLAITQPGYYSLTYTPATGNCPSFTDYIIVEFQDCLGINQQQKINDAAIYPNPAENDVVIAYGLSEDATVEYTLTNVLGQVIYKTSKFETAGQYHKNISLENQPSGIYFIRIFNGSNSFTGKIIKQ